MPSLRTIYWREQLALTALLFGLTAWLNYTDDRWQAWPVLGTIVIAGFCFLVMFVLTLPMKMVAIFQGGGQDSESFAALNLLLALVAAVPFLTVTLAVWIGWAMLMLLGAAFVATNCKFCSCGHICKPYAQFCSKCGLKLPQKDLGAIAR